MPISLLIVALLAIVVHLLPPDDRGVPVRRRQLHRRQRQPRQLPGLTAAASLLIDYVLTVSVSIAAGVAAITSLVPELLPYAVEISSARSS